LKQSSWDRPGIEKDRESIESGLTTAIQRTSFNAARSRHSGDWLLALPIVSCGLKLDDEAVRVAVGIRLALKLTSAAVEHKSTLLAGTVLYVSELQAEQ